MQRPGTQRRVSACCVRSSCGSHTACLGSVSDAEDMVQETFIRWLEDRPQRSARARSVPAPDGLHDSASTSLNRCDGHGDLHRSLGSPIPFFVEEDGEVEDVTLPLMLVLEMSLSARAGSSFCCTMCSGWDLRSEAAAIERDVVARRQLAARASAASHPRCETPLQRREAARHKAGRGVL